MDHLVGAGYARCEPPLLQPAAAFFESGEDMRGRLYLTHDVSGTELCLRPEYTIPVCRQYIASPAFGQPASFSYCGPVFRLRRDGPGEFIQAGIESFGRADREAADAEILAVSLEAATLATSVRLETTIGDAGLFGDLLDSLAIPTQWRRRIIRGLAQGKGLAGILDAPRNGHIDHSGVLAALEGVDKKGARALVEDLLAIAGITSVGGRSAAEIADRFLEQAALKGGSGVPAEARQVMERYLAVSGDPDEASAALRALVADAKLPLEGALERFDNRLGFMGAHGLDVRALRFSTRLVRNLDYYTGFVFEARDAAKPSDPPLVGGGRYDRLATMLGASAPVPAVGASLWADSRAAGEAA
ncbi:ATP phosphoribosyltransferase regulatory subunit [Beijerinckiaceae bacterium RH AL1]|nr:ATP phosphoribosyltransferase regulatory subunit [Beijerinckiaceae bacterium RH CH11]VVB48380.1 ATP phosphoribosyltransferase regulatory subunit [Beijerinckiaceae bacterium RH AL8]VVC56324.1 ATP phosphoribosyltransferase regulatory subunit [Beijerinckiaceae bacterium RH AL1]